jgi:hypothetical protein
MGFGRCRHRPVDVHRGYVAMAFGIVATLALGIGLMSLVFYSNRKGHD